MSNNNFYSSAEDVIFYTGVKPSDLWIEDEEGEEGKTADEKLKEIIESWLIQIADKIHKRQRMNYLDELEEVPASVHDIAKRMCANKITSARLKREAPIQRIDDYTVQQVKDFVFTKEIERELNDLPHNRGIGFY